MIQLGKYLVLSQQIFLVPLLYTFEKDSIMYSILTIGSNEFEIGMGNKTNDSITFNYEKIFFKIDKKNRIG